MSVKSEIDRISTNIADAYSAVEDMGGTLPEERVSGNLAAAVRSIPAGGATESWELIGTLDAATPDILSLEDFPPLKKTYILFGGIIDLGSDTRNTGSSTMFRNLRLKTAEGWYDTPFKIGAGSHPWGLKSYVYVDSGSEMAIAYSTEPTTSSSTSIKVVLGGGRVNSKAYYKGYITGVEIALTVPDGIENEANGKIYIYGVKA